MYFLYHSFEYDTGHPEPPFEVGIVINAVYIEIDSVKLQISLNKRPFLIYFASSNCLLQWSDNCTPFL